MYSQCEILFPHSRAVNLKRLKEKEWQTLVERICTLHETERESLAFSHMMITICDCLNCDLGSYKAALGCVACSQRTINAMHETDTELLYRFDESCQQINEYLDETGIADELKLQI